MNNMFDISTATRSKDQSVPIGPSFWKKTVSSLVSEKQTIEKVEIVIWSF